MPIRLPSQLKATATLVLALVALPSLLLWVFPRGRAEGLERLLRQAALLQSFPASPRLAVPALWQQRLGPALAAQVWNRQRLWWQFWAEHGDGNAYLAIPLAALPEAARTRLPANSLKVDDLLVIAPDPLSLRLLDGELRLKQRESRGLDERCLHRLQQEQAVFWSAAGLGAIAGPVAPLLQHVQQGCLSLAIEGDQLALSGEATATPGYLAAAEQGGDGRLSPPLGPGQLLELRGASLDPILSALLARQLIREPLVQRYGVGDGQLALLRQAPFQLSLRTVPRGPFQAGLTLQLAVGREHQRWAQMLQAWRQALLDQGLVDAAPPLQRQGPAIRSTLFPRARWSREDGQVVGGWRWQHESGADPQLLLYLGPEPGLAISPFEGLPASPSVLQLRMRPQALAGLSLLPAEVPDAVRRSNQLALTATGQPRQPLSQLKGVLQWDRLP